MYFALALLWSLISSGAVRAAEPAPPVQIFPVSIQLSLLDREHSLEPVLRFKSDGKSCAAEKLENETAAPVAVTEAQCQQIIAVLKREAAAAQGPSVYFNPGLQHFEVEVKGPSYSWARLVRANPVRICDKDGNCKDESKSPAIRIFKALGQLLKP